MEMIRTIVRIDSEIEIKKTIKKRRNIKDTDMSEGKKEKKMSWRYGSQNLCIYTAVYRSLQLQHYTILCSVLL